MIALVNHTLTRGRAGSVWLAAGFAGLLIAKVGSNTLAQLLLNYFSQRTLARLSGTLCRQILATPLRRLEQVGVPRVLTTLTDDVAVIGWATINIPTLAMNGAILIGCALYLAWLSWQVLLAVLMLVVVGALIHRLLESRAFRHLQRARETRELLFQHFRTLTEGIKELKVHAGRRREFVIERVDPTLARLQYDSMSGVRHHVVAASWNQLLFYALLGVLLFAIPPIHAVSWETLTGFVLATLYMMTPVWTIMDSWPVLARGRIALAKVRDLGISLSGPPIAESETVAMPLAAVAQLEIDGVVFAYDDDAGESFVLGPLDLSLRPNELVFLVGGNGSGKSTLMKVLTGLYPPTRGAVRLNGHLIDDKNREWYSQHFTAVFSDFYLFDSLLGLDDSGVDERARQSLVRLELDSKVRVEGGRFSTIALSQGQRKRLALLTAFLEDRPIYVFDEWAADQDAHYRDIFYRQILPELRARGKTILVISHDDRYYHLGDRVLKLEYGKLVAS